MYGRPPQLIVIFINPNFIPSRSAAAVVNICQGTAVIKRAGADACYAVRDFHARQTAAVGKRIGTDVRYAIRDRYAR